MESLDSQGRILPVGAADQDIVSKKIADDKDQGQSPRHQQQKSVKSSHTTEKDKDAKNKEPGIDIIV